MPGAGRALILTPKQIKALGAAWKSGASAQEIADKYDLSINIVYAYLAIAGVRQVKNRVHLCRDEVTGLLREHSQFRTAKVLGVSTKVLRDHLIRWGDWTPNNIKAKTKKETPPPRRRSDKDCAKCGSFLAPGRYKIAMFKGDCVRLCFSC